MVRQNIGDPWDRVTRQWNLNRVDTFLNSTGLSRQDIIRLTSINGEEMNRAIDTVGLGVLLDSARC